MKPVIQFIKYLPSDLDALAGIKLQCWSETYRGIYPEKMITEFDLMKHKDKFFCYLENGYACYKILADQCLAGYLVFSMQNAAQSITKQPAVFMHALYLLRAHQRQGIGSAAFAIIKGFCKEHSVSNFYHNCNAHNHNAISFYQRMGGQIVARDTGHATRDEDQIVFLHAAT